MIFAYLLTRFAQSMFTLLNRVLSNKVVKQGFLKLVLLDGPTLPHSFLNYIFLSKEAYLNGAIEAEILHHERAHVQQRHTLDLLFVELLRAIFWVNPMLNFYRQAMVLNHEFLADDEVLMEGQSTFEYQHLLLCHSVSPVKLALASQFNYSFIKKRFVMMHKQTPRSRALILKFTVLPLLLASLYMFSDNIMAQAPRPEPVHAANPMRDQKQYEPRAGIPDRELEEYKALVEKYRSKATPNGDVKVSDADRKRLVMLDKTMSKAQQGTLNFMILEQSGVLPRNPPTEADIEKYKDPNIYGVWIDDRRVPNDELENYQASDFSQVYLSRLWGKARNVRGKYKYKFQLDLMTTDHYEAYRKETLERNKDTMYLRTRRKPVSN